MFRLMGKILKWFLISVVALTVIGLFLPTAPLTEIDQPAAVDEVLQSTALPNLDKTWPAEEWPLTVDSGELSCDDGNQMLFSSEGTTYHINGVRTEIEYADVLTIWKPPEEIMYNGQMIEGPRIGMVLLDEVSELCASRGRMYVGVNVDDL